MGYENLIVKKENQIAIVIINRPEKLNVLNLETLNSFTNAVKDLDKDNEVRAVIIAVAGNKAFCAGIDLNYLYSLNKTSEVRNFVDIIHNLCNSIENSSKVTIAAINGYCLGGGLEIAMSCDVRIATKNAKFGQPEVKLGIIPGAGGTQRLPMLVGLAKAKEMILTGEMIDSEEALSIGLISKIVERERLLNEAKNLANRINVNSFNAVKLAKNVLNNSFKPNYNLEKNAFVECYEHTDQKEGMKAFLEKRKPKFK